MIPTVTPAQFTRFCLGQSAKGGRLHGVVATALAATKYWLAPRVPCGRRQVILPIRKLQSPECDASVSGFSKVALGVVYKQVRLAVRNDINTLLREVDV